MKTQTKTFLSSSIGPVIVTQTHTLYMRFLSTHHKPAASFYKQSDNVADFRTETRPSLSEFTRTRLSQLLSARVIIGGNEGLREGKGKEREGKEASCLFLHARNCTVKTLNKVRSGRNSRHTTEYLGKRAHSHKTDFDTPVMFNLLILTGLQQAIIFTID